MVTAVRHTNAAPTFGGGWLTAPITRDAASIVGVIVTVWFLYSFQTLPAGYDSYAYWAVDPWAPYSFDGSVGQLGAFRYSPAAAQVLALVNWVPWGVFFWGWLAMLLACLAWLGRWWTLAALAFAPVLMDLYIGNIEVLLAFAIVAGLRWPATWSIVLLTKVTPGVGLLWFVVRREWRNLGIALGVTAVIAGVSFLLAPQLWLDWPRALLAVDSSPYGGFAAYAPRWIAAALIVVWGARTNRPWTLVVAGTLAITWLDSKTAALLVGLVAFLPRTRTAHDR